MMILLIALALAAFQPADTIRVTDRDWRTYDAQGNPSSLDAIVRAARGADVLFIGETHDDPVVHHLQRELLERVFADQHPRGVFLSMEMFCRDVQYVVDEYLEGLISESHFLASSSPWPNYATDYRPLVEFSRAHGLAVVAANAPRRYVNRVSRLGRASLGVLSERARAALAPLPYGEASETYRAEWDALMAESMAEMAARRAADTTAAGRGEPSDTTAEGSPDTPASPSPAAAGAPPMTHSPGSLMDSQALWDATMAYSIAEALMRRPGSLAVHVVGAFHVEHHTGIPEHLALYRPGVRQLVVTVRPVGDLSGFDPDAHRDLADFVVLADETLPRTHTR